MGTRPTLHPSSRALRRAMGLLVVCRCRSCRGESGNDGIVKFNSSTPIDGVGDIHMRVEL